jgi:hypothetical protein
MPVVAGDVLLVGVLAVLSLRIARNFFLVVMCCSSGLCAALASFFVILEFVFDIAQHGIHIHAFLLSIDMIRNIFVDFCAQRKSYTCLHFEHLRKSLLCIASLHLVHESAILRYSPVSGSIQSASDQ